MHLFPKRRGNAHKTLKTETEKQNHENAKSHRLLKF